METPKAGHLTEEKKGSLITVQVRKQAAAPLHNQRHVARGQFKSYTAEQRASVGGVNKNEKKANYRRTDDALGLYAFTITKEQHEEGARNFAY